MTINRRNFVTGGTALTAAIIVNSNYAWATSSLLLGSIKIDVLSDGHLSLPVDIVFQGLTSTEIERILKKHSLPTETLHPECNLTLLRDGKNTILFDVGAGPNFMSSAGKIQQAFEVLNVEPSSVTHVVFTHAHPDHLWGLLDDFDELVFSQAQYMIGKTEWDYWVDPKTIDTIGSTRQIFAVGAKRNLLAIEDKISFFAPEQEILPGVYSQASFGHTPGHMSFEVRSGNESVMIIGDAIGNHHVSFENPEWEINSDQDRAQGAKARTLLLDQLASHKMRMIGYHLPNNGVGYAEKTGNSYKFIGG